MSVSLLKKVEGTFCSDTDLFVFQNEEVTLRMAKYTGITVACTALAEQGYGPSATRRDKLVDQVRSCSCRCESSSVSSQKTCVYITGCAYECVKSTSKTTDESTKNDREPAKTIRPISVIAE